MHNNKENNKKKNKKIADYLVGEYLNTEEFLTIKERKSFEQVEKFVSKKWDKTLDEMSKKKAERGDSDGFDYGAIVDEFTDWEEKYVNLELEKMITAVGNNSKSNTNRISIKVILMYILYIVIIGGVALLLARENGLF